MKMKQYPFALLLSLTFLFYCSSLEAQQIGKKDTTGMIGDDQNKVYDKPEVTASVDSIIWKKHLYKQLSQFLLQPSSADIPAGKYTVKVQFVVERDGSLSNVKAMENPGYGMAEAAIKVLQTGPKWKAAEQGGNKVRSYRIQPISFFIQTKNPSTQ
jgi:periplasmic protein TonB